MNKSNMLAGLVLLALCGSVAMAADNTVGVLHTGSSVKDNDADKTVDSNGFKLFYQQKFTDILGIQADYTDYGSFKASANMDGVSISDKVDFKSYGVSVFADKELNDWFAVFGRVGYAHWEAKLKETMSSDLGTMIGSGSDSGNDFNYAVGARFMFSNSFGIRIEHEVQKTDNEDVTSNNIGVEFHF